MNQKSIIGIDPGLATTGFGIIRPGDRPRSFKLVDSGAIRTESNQELSSRLEIIYEKVKELVDQYEPNTVAVEKVFYSKNKKTAGLVAQARGVIVLASSSAEIAGYSPLEVKKTITGYGRANKNQIKMMIKKLLNLQDIPQPADAADALGIALCGGLDRGSALKKRLSEDR